VLVEWAAEWFANVSRSQIETQATNAQTNENGSRAAMSRLCSNRVIQKSGPLALPEESESLLDRVSTGSGSDLVSDQHAALHKIYRFLISLRNLGVLCVSAVK